jgi:hypothetical protein
MTRIASLFTILALVGCAKPHTISSASGLKASRLRATECVQLCTDLGMKMTAMVVIMSNAGCVCEPAAATARTSTNGAVAASGIAVVEDTQQKAAAQAHHHQQQQQQQQPTY